MAESSGRSDSDGRVGWHAGRPSRGRWAARAAALAAGVALAVLGATRHWGPAPAERPPTAERSVRFVLVAPQARSVHLVGDFNDWNADATPLRGSRRGAWETTLNLPPGHYTYSFVMDGTTWLGASGAPRAAADDFGRPSSVLLVESSRT